MAKGRGAKKVPNVKLKPAPKASTTSSLPNKGVREEPEELGKFDCSMFVLEPHSSFFHQMMPIMMSRRIVCTPTTSVETKDPMLACPFAALALIIK
jgi:hypothetical protein